MSIIQTLVELRGIVTKSLDNGVVLKREDMNPLTKNFGFKDSDQRRVKVYLCWTTKENHLC